MKLNIIITADDTCSGKPQYSGAPVIAGAVMEMRNDLKLSQNVSMKVAAQVVPFGETNGNLTLARVENCTKGGPIDICTLCRVVSVPTVCDNPPLYIHCMFIPVTL